jgi:hypothetical protein
MDAADSTATSQQFAVRLKGQFTPAFLTLTSIIQGVAFTTLVARVEANAAQFTLADWTLSTATFIGFVVIWHEYLMQALAYVWIPTLLDSLVPFAFLAAELFMAHFAYGNMQAWLLAAAAASGAGLLVWATNFTGARIPSSDNSELLRVTSSYIRPRFISNLLLLLLFLAAWAGYDLFHLGSVPLIVAGVSLLLFALFLFGSVPFWNAVVTYARDEREHQLLQAPPAHTAP